MTDILLVEDDPSIVSTLSEFLKSEGFSVEAVPGQVEALSEIGRKSFDLVLLDVSLENGNGFVVCSEIKKKHDTPVIFLTASGDEYSVVAGLDMGADDYIAKPFCPRELISRIKNVLRRSSHAQPIIKIGNVKIDTYKGIAYKNSDELYLSALEYRLLLMFFTNKGVILNRNRILEEIWDAAGDYVNDNTLTVYIKRLREKVEDDPQNPTIIKTVRGLGYKVGE